MHRSKNTLGSKCKRDYGEQKYSSVSAANAAKYHVFLKDLNIPPTNPFPCFQRLIRKRKRTSNDDDRDSPLIEIKKRCRICSKKVGLTGFGCKCGQIFCGAHRHPEAHQCNYDFKIAGKLCLIKENPVCKADKLKDRV